MQKKWVVFMLHGKLCKIEGVQGLGSSAGLSTLGSSSLCPKSSPFLFLSPKYSWMWDADLEQSKTYSM